MSNRVTLFFIALLRWREQLEYETDQWDHYVVLC